MSNAPIPPAVSENIEALEAWYARQDQRVGRAQRAFERLSSAIGRPWFLVMILIVVALWILYNSFAPEVGLTAFDPAPFAALQGIVSLAALIITTVVLIGQNRLARQERQREEMELQVNILTEQKTTKLVHLIEELRHDLPMVRDRHDPDAAVLQQPTHATEILSALDKKKEGA